VPVWAWLVAAMAVLAVYALALSNGPALKAGATTLHELFHDARHFMGVPCH
jgi:Probable cobalt transporter subunit (CbtB)